MRSEVPGGCAMPTQTNTTTKKMLNAYGLEPPEAFPAPMRARASGARARLAARGHRPHGASQANTPTATARIETITTAGRLRSAGPGRGTVTADSRPEPT